MSRFWKRAQVQVFLMLLALLALFASVAHSSLSVVLSDGQIIYVPVYSHIYYGDRDRVLNLTTTVSIRNTDPTSPITVTQVNYHDSNGKLVKKYIEKPIDVGPLASIYYLVKESDVSGGDVPSFIVKWKSSKKVNAPIIEGVMIGTASNQGISFVLPGQEIVDEERK
jgi:hypothetical protein